MNDIAARVVDGAQHGEETATPEGVGTNAVREGEPEGYVDHPGEEVHAAEEGARCDYEGDSREDKLEVHHRRHREVCADVGCG